MSADKSEACLEPTARPTLVQRAALGVAVLAVVLWVIIGSVVLGRVVVTAHQKPQVERVVTDWTGALLLSEALSPGTRPVLEVRHGDPDRVCALLGFPAPPSGAYCEQGRQVTFGTEPRLLDLGERNGVWVGVLAYTNGSVPDQRWLGLQVNRVGDGWLIVKYADLPFSAEPDLDSARRTLVNVATVRER